MNISRNFKQPLVILLAVILGGNVGSFFPAFSSSLLGINEILSNLLKMCVIPIVVSSLIVEIVSFLKSAEQTNIKKLISISMVVSLVFAVIATFFSFMYSPGARTTFSNESVLTEKIIQASIVERGLDEPIETQNSQNLFGLFSKAVPKNIFGAFSSNKTLQIIFFTVIFSLALSTVPQSETLRSFFYVTRESFLKIFTYALKFLPLLVFTSTALAVSRIGFQVFLDMAPFLNILFLQLFIIFVVNLWILHRNLRISFLEILKRLEASLMVAFGGSVLAATIPTVGFFNRITETNKQFVQIITPITMFLNRFGNILYFCFCCFFIGQIYEYHFTYEQILFIITFSILGGIASAGSTEGFTSVFLLSILDPVNIPGAQVILILSSLDFMIGPFLSILTVQTNIMVLSFLIPRTKGLKINKENNGG